MLPKDRVRDRIEREPPRVLGRRIPVPQRHQTVRALVHDHGEQENGQDRREAARSDFRPSQLLAAGFPRSVRTNPRSRKEFRPPAEAGKAAGKRFTHTTVRSSCSRSAPPVNSVTRRPERPRCRAPSRHGASPPALPPGAAELLTLRRRRLAHPVGVEQQHVARSADPSGAPRSASPRSMPSAQPALGQMLDACRRRAQNRRIVTGVGEREHVVLGVEHAVERGDELAAVGALVEQASSPSPGWCGARTGCGSRPAGWRGTPPSAAPPGCPCPRRR